MSRLSEIRKPWSDYLEAERVKREAGAVTMTKYRKGDEVTVHARVRNVDHFPEIGFTFSNGETPELTFALYLPESQIATHTPKPRELKVGDMVTWDAKVNGYRLVFIGYEHSVIEHRGEPKIVATSKLEPWPVD